MALYLLHFDRPLGTPGGHIAQHYLGYVCDAPGALDRRVQLHQRGEADCAITRAAHERGIPVRLVRVWPFETKEDERRRKRAGRFSRYCPVCGNHRVNPFHEAFKETGSWPQPIPNTR